MAVIVFLKWASQKDGSPVTMTFPGAFTARYEESTHTMSELLLLDSIGTKIASFSAGETIGYEIKSPDEKAVQ